MNVRNAVSSPPDDTAQEFVGSLSADRKPNGLGRERVSENRRTPRKSVIVVLPDNHVVSPERLSQRLASDRGEPVDIIVACAGQPMNLGALQRTVGDAQFLLAPAGTTSEDLRELAMKQAPGDIVTVLRGVAMPPTSAGDWDIHSAP